MNFSLVFSIVGAVTGISGMIVGILGVIRCRYQTVNEFFATLEKPEFISARREVYNTNPFNLDDQNAAYVINFFHHWGLMAKKHYLPIWVFDGASGEGVIRLYKCLEDHIREIRDKNHDEKYAEYFEWVYRKSLGRRA